MGALKLGVSRCASSVGIDGTLPLRRYNLSSARAPTPFAVALDAEALNAYRAQMEAAKGPSRELAKSVAGYLSALFMRTVPKAFLNGPRFRRKPGGM
ncbi:MAG: hypothetical protein U0235_34580 [Polyangiaceae bacterium]